MLTHLLRTCALSVGSILLFMLVSVAGQDDLAPVTGLRENTPEIYALVGARVVVAPGEVLPEATIVIREGRIESIGADIAPPADARVYDMTGQVIYPGLIDPYTEASISLPSGGFPYWNEQVQPQRSIARLWDADASATEQLRELGFVARLVAPDTGVIRGQSAVLSTAEGEKQELLAADVAQHMKLTVARYYPAEYPRSPMGAVALARQACYDGQWYAASIAAHQSNASLALPTTNDALTAMQPYLFDDKLTIIEALDDQYLLRADRFAHEFGLKIAICGSGHEYRRVEAIANTGRLVIVPLNFPKPPNVGTPEAASRVTLERLMHWDHAPENPARLAAAGVRIALTTHRLENRGDFLERLREAVSRGLDAEEALTALTTTPAELLGIEDQLGSLRAGKLASFFVTDGDLFEEETTITETWVAGERYEHASSPLFDLRGVWQVERAGEEGEAWEISLTGKPQNLQGHLRLAEGSEDSILLRQLDLRDAQFHCSFDGTHMGHPGVVQLSVVVSPHASEDFTWLGHLHWPDGSRTHVTGQRIAEPEASNQEDASQEASSDVHDEDLAEAGHSDEEGESTPELPEVTPQVVERSASYPVNYPLGSFGRLTPAEQPPVVLFQNATLWTCDDLGIVEQGSVLVERGVIVAVGRIDAIPENAYVVDCTGMHLTPGIVDCHSHMATDGGVNESTQTITAEVRIGDFIDATDVNIYRQLAGGVTVANVLHGSANPIGGQNQVIKLRWGLLPEELKFAEAPSGIKFALGENVTRSNWHGEHDSRYPQTRMGVEQLYRNAFEAASEYRRQWDNWETAPVGLPPRRDLELDALAEVVAGDRWIHCHSYRQDEVIALLNLLEEHGIQIGTLQHILEGYKVAEELYEHGAMASSFADWWAYKMEAYDAIPHNGALMHQAGVVVSFNSDSPDLARHLNQEAAKAVRHGGVSEEEALKFVTLNPAIQLRIDAYVGSLTVGKQADLALWSGPPLSNLSRCEQTWIEGRCYFNRQEDLAQREQTEQQRFALIQKILSTGIDMVEPGEEKPMLREMWPRTDLFCGHHGHGHSHHQQQQHQHEHQNQAHQH